jgi:hypothetical protein
MRATADFAASFPGDTSTDPDTPAGYKIETGGTPVYLTLTGEQLMGIDIGLAEIQVSEFLNLRGSLAFRKGERHVVDVNPGGLSTIISDLGGGDTFPLDVEFMTIGGANLTGFAGVGGPYRYGVDANNDGLLDSINDGAVGLVIDNVDFGLAIMTPALAAIIPGGANLSPKFIAAKAHVDDAMLVGVDPDIMDVQAHDITININTTVIPNGGPIVNAALQIFGPPSINWQTSFDTSPEDANGNGVLDPGEDRDGNGVLATYGPRWATRRSTWRASSSCRPRWPSPRRARRRSR